jgi:hypothetical protein
MPKYRVPFSRRRTHIPILTNLNPSMLGRAASRIAGIFLCGPQRFQAKTKTVMGRKKEKS